MNIKTKINLIKKINKTKSQSINKFKTININNKHLKN